MSDAIYRMADRARSEFVGGFLCGIKIDVSDVNHLLALALSFKDQVDSQFDTIKKFSDIDDSRRRRSGHV